MSEIVAKKLAQWRDRSVIPLPIKPSLHKSSKLYHSNISFLKRFAQQPLNPPCIPKQINKLALCLDPYLNTVWVREVWAVQVVNRQFRQEKFLGIGTKSRSHLDHLQDLLTHDLPPCAVFVAMWNHTTLPMWRTCFLRSSDVRRRTQLILLPSVNSSRYNFTSYVKSKLWS